MPVQAARVSRDLGACLARVSGVSCFFSLHAAIDTWGQPNRLAIYSLTLDRDLDIASVAILAALLLIHNYYGLSLEPLQRTIAAGICLVCAIDVIGEHHTTKSFHGLPVPLCSWPASTPLWFSLSVNSSESKAYGARSISSASWLSMGIWCYALRKPIPARIAGSRVTACRGLSGTVAGDQFASQRF